MKKAKVKQPARQKRILWRILAVTVGTLALTAYLAGGLWLYLKQEDFIFPRTVNHIEPPDAGHHDATRLSLTTPDGAILNGLLFGPAGRTPSTTLVLAFGGNAHDVTGMVRFLHDDVFPEGNITVAGFSYRGYPNALGRPSTGIPTEENLESDARLIYDRLTARLKPTRVIAIGYSLGTAVATHLATQRQLDSVILAAPFASIARLAHDAYPIYPTGLMLKHPFYTDAIIGRVTAPVTIVYSAEDGLIPGEHIAILRRNAPKANLVELIPPIRHGQILDHPQIPQIFRKAAGL